MIVFAQQNGLRIIHEYTVTEPLTTGRSVCYFMLDSPMLVVDAKLFL
jgi:hypothetical protein